MTARVSFTIANPVLIRLVRYRLQRHQLPVRPLLQLVLRIPVSWSCIIIPEMSSSMCSIQTTVSRKIAVKCKFNTKWVFIFSSILYASLGNFVYAINAILYLICPDYYPTHQKKFCAKVDIAWMHTRPRYTPNWYKLYAYYMLMSEK